MSKMFMVVCLSLALVLGFGISSYADNSGDGGSFVVAQMGPGPGGPGGPMGPPMGPGGPGGGMNQALDMCYGKCVQSLQMCLKPSLAPGYKVSVAKTLVGSCTDTLKRCMLACPK